MGAEVVGTRRGLFTLVLKTTTLSVLTLGVYSFWARTRVRRWLWSAMRLGGTPFEYVGQPLEKLMGFVIAAVIVAVYLGLVVMVLIFASLQIWLSPAPGIAASFALILPVYWFAQYRGMRYLLNHTRWRGIGFSMRPGAWRYSGLAIFWTILSAATLGLLWPVRTQRLWRFRAARAYYGDDHFRLTLRARDLIVPFVPVLAVLWGGAALAFFGGAIEDQDALVGLVMLAVPMLALAWLYWRVVSFRRLASSLAFAGAAGLSVAPRTGRVLGIHMGGWVLVGLLLIVGAIALFFGFVASFFGFVASLPALDLETLATASPATVFFAALLFYLTFFLGRGALRMVFVTFPLIRHVGETLTVQGAAEVNAVRAGEVRHMHDADGFANLFDLGAGV